MFDGEPKFSYCPILSISLSETTALKELPNKDKDKILPIFPLKSWATSKELKNSLDRVKNSIGTERYWIADIDQADLKKRNKKKYKPVHEQIKKLLIPNDGYSNWCNFIEKEEKILPTLQLGDLNELTSQIQRFSSIKKGMVLILRKKQLESPKELTQILNLLERVDNILIIIDLEQIDKDQIKYIGQIEKYLHLISNKLPMAKLCVSSTSYPGNFGGFHHGTKTIYERALYDKLALVFPELIYSDRGGARAIKFTGGGGTPPPRIDYSCRNEWHFVRLEFQERGFEINKIDKVLEKKMLYTKIAKTIMEQNYWEPKLNLWSNYVIELTAKGDDFGINSAQKATAVRINKHLYTQLHYYEYSKDINDTDDDWVD